MSAYVQAAYFYAAYCADCRDGIEPHPDEEEAEAWAANHDAENHEEDDPAEIARQEWKDSRHD